jgi:large subunit ribosomal protein L7Ae
MAEAKDLQDKAYEAVEIARKTGKIKKGINEVTKIIEKGMAKLVLVAEDTSPKEIIMHIGPLCEEKQVPFVMVPSKEELGAASGLDVSTTAVVVVNEGDAKQNIKQIKEATSKK